MKNNENKEICSKCKGRCCKNMGCHYSPRDFEKIEFEYLKNRIEKENISIDWWDGDILSINEYSRVYYLRCRNIDSEIVNPSWGGQCMNLTDNGCNLSFKDRPLGGKMVIPQESYNCINEYSKEDCVKEWRAYHSVLDKLCDYFKEI